VISGDRIEPFRALVYNADQAGDWSELVAPPYDLIGPQRQQQLYDRSPFNVVRLEYGKEKDRYAAAAETMRKWQSERILERVATPALYFYSQCFDYEGRHLRRDGFIVRLRLEAFAPGRILPHERTFAAAKQDRLRLLEATRTNLSPIFGLYSGAHPELDVLRKRLRSRPASIHVRDDLKIDNELRIVQAAAEIKIVREALRDSRILIADGHHRYETALNYQRQRRAAEDYHVGLQPYDYVMISLVSCEDPGLVILPTHRVVQRLDTERIAKFDARAGESFSIESFGDRDSMRGALARAGRGATGVFLRGGSRPKLLKLKRADLTMDAMPDQRAEVRELDVSILHGLVFEKILGLKDFDVRRGGNIEYTIDSEAAFDSVAEGKADGAFFLNPPSIRDVERVSDAGATMPEKSTYFFPKLLTGLVMNPLLD
jgi:uncharacterized protein (DUF1015 family)